MHQCFNFSRIGGKFHSLCGECSENLTKEDASDWAEFSTKLLAKMDDKFVMGALGCASIAMALGANAHDLLRSMAKELHARKKHELAYSIISLNMSEYNDNATKKAASEGPSNGLFNFAGHGKSSKQKCR